MNPLYAPIAVAAAALFFLLWLKDKVVKTILFVALLAAGAWFVMAKIKQNARIQEIQQSAVNYTQGLRTDVSRAQAAQKTADASIKQETQGFEKSLKQAEGGNAP